MLLEMERAQHKKKTTNTHIHPYTHTPIQKRSYTDSGVNVWATGQKEWLQRRWRRAQPQPLLLLFLRSSPNLLYLFAAFGFAVSSFFSAIRWRNWNRKGEPAKIATIPKNSIAGALFKAGLEIGVREYILLWEQNNFENIKHQRFLREFISLKLKYRQRYD